MMKNVRTLALGGCLAALGTLSVVSAVMAQGPIITPPHNCQCGPLNDCEGNPITASRYCDYDAGQYCYCITHRSPGGCVIGLSAMCGEFPSN